MQNAKSLYITVENLVSMYKLFNKYNDYMNLKDLEIGEQALREIPVHKTLVLASSVPQQKSNLPKPAHPTYVLEVKPEPNVRKEPAVLKPALPEIDEKSFRAQFEKRNKSAWILLGTDDGAFSGVLKNL